MNVTAIILPHDEQLLSVVLTDAARRGLILQTDGRKNVMCSVKLPGFARITGGGTHTPAPEPEAA